MPDGQPIKDIVENYCNCVVLEDIDFEEVTYDLAYLEVRKISALDRFLSTNLRIGKETVTFPKYITQVKENFRSEF